MRPDDITEMAYAIAEAALIVATVLFGLVTVGAIAIMLGWNP